ncbi:hypothetical protein FRB98_003760, partial [Tulasnella sp. 332]
NNLPHGLLDYVERDPHLSMNGITAITLFPDDGWFITYCSGWATHNVPHPIGQAVTALPEGFASVASIEFDASNPWSYIISVYDGDPLFADLPPMLIENIVKLSFDGLEGFWIGYAGAHVVTSNNRFRLNLNQAQDSDELMAFMKGSNIGNLVLSPYNSGHWFAVLPNGKQVWRTPQHWNHMITDVSTASDTGSGSGVRYNPGRVSEARPCHADAAATFDEGTWSGIRYNPGRVSEANPHYTGTTATLDSAGFAYDDGFGHVAKLDSAGFTYNDGHGHVATFKPSAMNFQAHNQSDSSSGGGDDGGAYLRIS